MPPNISSKPATSSPRCARLGVGFALEHFGIDQDRFQILDLLKPDYIKVDGELMHTLISDSEYAGRCRPDRPRRQ